MARTEGEVGVNLLETIEGGVEDGEAALDDGAVAEGVDVAGVDDVALGDSIAEGARLRAGPVARYALTVLGLKQEQ